MSYRNVISYDGVEPVHLFKNVELVFGSRLLVRDYQVALVVEPGRRITEYESGMHYLDIRNSHILKAVSKLLYDDNPYKVEVYFGSVEKVYPTHFGGRFKAYQKDTKIEETFTFTCRADIKLNSLEEIYINSPLLLNTLTAQAIEEYLRGPITAKISSVLSKIAVRKDWDVVDLNQKICGINDILKKCIADEFFEYGFVLESINISSIEIAEGLKRHEVIQEAKTTAVAAATLGINNETKMLLDILEKYGQNGDTNGSASLAMLPVMLDLYDTYVKKREK